MKKAKIMLTCVVVLSVVGGALAFKAKNVDQKFVCVGDIGATICPTLVRDVTADLTDPNGNGTPTAFTIVQNAAGCDAQTACLTTSGFTTPE